MKTNGLPGLYEPSLSNNFSGLLVTDGFADPEIIRVRARQLCDLYGGLNESSLKKVPPPSHVVINLGGSEWYEYACQGLNNIHVKPSQPIEKNGTDISEIKKKCKDIGFVEYSEKYNNCVSTLSN